MRKNLTDGTAVRGKSEDGDVFRLRTFLPFADFVRDFLSLFKVDAAVTAFVDLTVMHENILPAVIRLNESVSFLAVEPFYRSVNLICHCCSFCDALPNGSASLCLNCASGGSVEK